MPKPKLLILTALALFLASILLVKFQSNQTPLPNPSPSLSPAPTASLSYLCQKGKTAFEVLEKTAVIEFTTSSYGKLVTSINGAKQANNQYWLYSIDEKPAEIGADSFLCQDREIILWELK